MDAFLVKHEALRICHAARLQRNDDAVTEAFNGTSPGTAGSVGERKAQSVFVYFFGKGIGFRRAAMPVVINRVEVDRDPVAFLQDVELKDRPAVEKLLVGIVPGPAGIFRRRSDR